MNLARSLHRRLLENPSRLCWIVGCLVSVLVNLHGVEPARLLDGNLYLLGAEGGREWQEFAGMTPHGRRLDIPFDARKNAGASTLFIRQRDVKLNWSVELNSRKLGTLLPMEADLVNAFSVPEGVLRDGDNILSIIPPAGLDDILVGEIKLAAGSIAEALSDATLTVKVSDEVQKTPLPCRITVVDANGSLHPVHLFTNGFSVANTGHQPSTRAIEPLVAVRPGVIYSIDGSARFGLPSGRYVIYATRGFEYSVRTNEITLAPGAHRTLEMRLRHELPTPRLVSCDTHVHTFTFSGHGDATLDERMATIAGEGIELPIATDHNTLTDYSEAVRRLKVQDFFTAVIGDEVTTESGHFNIFPVEPGSRVPDHRIQDWPKLMQVLRTTPGVQVVILNHPRNLHSNFQPFAATNFNQATGENRRGPDFSFDAVEVLNSSALQSDLMLGFRDWFALLNYGYRITAVGSSDSHDVSRYIVGQGRTYVACGDSVPGKIDVKAACESILAGRALVSLGLLVRVTVNDKFTVGDLATGLGDTMRVTAIVSGPSWIRADRVELYANGLKIREERIKSPDGSIEKARVTWQIPRPLHDAHLVAIASGPPVTAPFWALAKPYQPSSTVWEPRVIGATNPVWIDADGDGKFTAPRGYARMLFEKAGRDPGRLIDALAAYDEAIATQAASLCQAAAVDVREIQTSRIFEKAAPQVRRGFETYAATLLPK